MKTFNFKPTPVSHTLKTRILNLWNPTASPLGHSITAQSLMGEGEGAAVQSRHQDVKVSTGTMAPDGGGEVIYFLSKSRKGMIQ
jgi:hypothetical protein